MLATQLPRPLPTGPREADGVAPILRDEPIDNGHQPLPDRRIRRIEQAGLHRSGGHQVEEQHPGFLVAEPVAPDHPEAA